ncbi:MAG: magnesium transporter [Pseudomonadota bacterium]
MVDPKDPGGTHTAESSGSDANLHEAITPGVIARFVGVIGDGDRHWLRREMAAMHPADAADVLEQLPREAFHRAVRMLGADLPPEALAELSEDVLGDALDDLSDADIAAALEALDSDDGGTLLQDMEEARRDRILAQVNAGDRAALETSLSFDEETAGRLMQRDFVAAPHFWTVGQAIDHMRGTEDLPDVFFEVYLVDPAFRLVGAVRVSTLLQATRETALSDLQVETATTVRPEMDQEEVAYLFQQYNLASAPVVDEAGRLTGMITVDDMVDVIQEENKEDLLALSGVNEAGANQSVWDAVRARAPWLGVNLFTAFLVSGVISIFEATIQEIVALAILMPVVAALGGNAGSQALAVAVRALAERDLTNATAGRAIRREALTASLNGIIFAVGVGVIAFVWFGDARLAGVIGAAMFGTFLWAGLVGVLAPLALQRMGADPAVASSVFVLTTVDVVGFLAFLGLASLLLI